MNWFKKHLNWTYLLSIVLAFLIALLIVVISVFVVVKKSSPFYPLYTYLDESYTSLWSETDVPNLDSLPWSAADSSGWQTATFTAYLENRGNLTVEVKVVTTEEPRFATPGFSASSDVVVLKPNERSPTVIKMSRNPAVQSALSPDKAWETIYFQVQPVSLDENVVELVYWITIIPILVGSTAWVLHQKGRSYGWLLLSLTGIGVIIILCLENKRLISEPEAEKGIS